MGTTTKCLRAAVIVGSTRPNRIAPAVAAWVAAADRSDLELTVVDLAEVSLPMLDEPQPPAWGDYARPLTWDWSRLVASFDAFVLVSPEYNHSTSAVLKNALDHLHAEWADKAVGFVGYGLEGGTRATEHLRVICAELGLAGVRPQVSLRLQEVFRDGRFEPGDAQTGARDRMLDALARWAGALAPLRRPTVAELSGRAGDGTAPERPVLDKVSRGEQARAVAERFMSDLQEGLVRNDAERYDASFAADILWGSPYGATVTGIGELLPIHRRLMAARVAPPSRFELVHVLAPADGMVVAQIRRRPLGGDGEFSEMAMYVLVERDGRWWLAAGQNTPIGQPPGPGLTDRGR
jgi:NAD(P)H-dependent FMN reductase